MVPFLAVLAAYSFAYVNAKSAPTAPIDPVSTVFVYPTPSEEGLSELA